MTTNEINEMAKAINEAYKSKEFIAIHPDNSLFDGRPSVQMDDEAFLNRFHDVAYGLKNYGTKEAPHVLRSWNEDGVIYFSLLHERELTTPELNYLGLF